MPARAKRAGASRAKKQPADPSFGKLVPLTELTSVASSAKIAMVERRSGVRLPADYVRFLSRPAQWKKPCRLEVKESNVGFEMNVKQLYRVGDKAHHGSVDLVGMNDIIRGRGNGLVPSDAIVIGGTTTGELFVLFGSRRKRKGVWLKTFVDYSAGGVDAPDAELFFVADSFRAFWKLIGQA